MACIAIPAVAGCNGPGGYLVCDTCWQQEIADNSGTAPRVRPPEPHPDPYAAEDSAGELGAEQSSKGKVSCPDKDKRDLISLAWLPALPAKVYEDSAASWECRAVTKPHNRCIWTDLDWSEGAAGTYTNRHQIKLSPAGDKTVTVGLDGKPCAIQAHIRRWPVLQVNTVEFDSRMVYGDGKDFIDKAFDAKWVKGRAAAGMNIAPGTCQAPVCYPGAATISLTVTFDVATRPTDAEDVGICGAVVFKDGARAEWRDTVKVSPGDAQVKTKKMAASVALPAGVNCYDKLTIQWSMKTYQGADGPPGGAGSTDHLLYVTLGEPDAGAKAYWTLLDISCRAASGKTDEPGFVPAAFIPFTTHRGDDNGFPRMGDGIKLSYYLQGVNTSGDQGEPFPVYSTRGILGRADGTGRCGGWARLLVDMFRIHGVVSAKRFWMIRSKDPKNVDGNKRFLVKNCQFTGPGSLAAWSTGFHFAGFATEKGLYTHRGAVDCIKLSGAAGQGKTNPQFDFADHVVVKHGGKLYDPSYGIEPCTDQFEYEGRALDGLGSMANGSHRFKMIDPAATPQFISLACSPGFLEYVALTGETLAVVAAKCGGTASLLFNDPMNADLKSSLQSQYDRAKAVESAAAAVSLGGWVPSTFSKTAALPGPEAIPLDAGTVVRVPRSLLTVPMLDGYVQ